MTKEEGFNRPTQQQLEEMFQSKDSYNLGKVDMVNSPPHYADRQIEVIDFMKDTMSRERFLGYMEGCVIKYMSRWDKKGKPQQDLQKASWYLNRLIKELEE